MFTKLASYIKESKQELKRVNWPTFQETYRLTVIVIVLALLVSAFLGILDFIFTEILRIAFL